MKKVRSYKENRAALDLRILNLSSQIRFIKASVGKILLEISFRIGLCIYLIETSTK